MSPKECDFSLNSSHQLPISPEQGIVFWGPQFIFTKFWWLDLVWPTTTSVNRPLLHPCNVGKAVPHSSFSSSSILYAPCSSSSMKWSGLIQMTHLHLNPHGYYTRHLSIVLSSLTNVEYDTNLRISVAYFLLLLKIRWLVLLISTTYIQYILIILTFLFLFLTLPRSTPPSLPT